MKLRISLFILCLTLSARAQTNEITLPTLTIGSESYTNATVRKLNPAEAVVWYDGGNRKVFINHLPDSMQSQFHYDADSAREFIQTRSEKDAEFKKRYAEEAAQEAALEAQHNADLAKQAAAAATANAQTPGAKKAHKNGGKSASNHANSSQ